MKPKVKGSQPWAVILCKTNECSDSQNLWSIDYFRSLIAEEGARGLNDYWSAISLGHIDLKGSEVFGWYNVPYDVAQLDNIDRAGQASLARTTASNAGVDLSRFKNILAIYGDCGKYGVGAIGNDVVVGLYFNSGQPGWRHCTQCESLVFWDGSRLPGLCAAGGRHTLDGYYAPIMNSILPGGQTGWRWCCKCEAMVFNNPATCPAGGQHDLSQSADYQLRLNGQIAVNEQDNWWWCSKCQGLAYWDKSRLEGVCSMNGRHDHSSSGTYCIPIGCSVSIADLAHETGHGYGLDHAFNTNRSGDFYNDNRPGAYGDSTDVMGTPARFAAPSFTDAGTGLSAPTLYKLGWLAGQVKKILPNSGTQTITLGSLYLVAGGTGQGTKSPSGELHSLGTRMIQIVRPSENLIFTASFRVAKGWDQGLGHDRVVAHQQLSLYSAGQDLWRYCCGCKGMIFAGQTQCSAGGVHDSSGSFHYDLKYNFGTFKWEGQADWRWCGKCSNLFFAGNGSLGRCPAGGEHDLSGSYDYVLSMNSSGGPGSQSNWRWCSKCQGLGYGGGSSLGRCPAGGFHDYASSGNYTLTHYSYNLPPTPPPPPGHQNKWRWCNKCQGLYYAGVGTCQGGLVHDFSKSTDYALTANLPDAAGQSGWKWCCKCYGLAYHDGSRSPGRCPTGGLHDHSTSWMYTLPFDAETSTAQRHWWFCKKCSAVNYSDSSRNTGTCSAGGNHENQGSEYSIAMVPAVINGEQRFKWCQKCESMVFGDNPQGCSSGGNHETSYGRYVVRTEPLTRYREQAIFRVCSKCNILMALATPGATDEKQCPMGGQHTPRNDEYFLTLRTTYPLWRWCRKCESLANWDDNGIPGPCPAGGTHDHSESGFYCPPNFNSDISVVVADDLKTGEKYTDPNGLVTIEVVSLGSGAKIQVKT